MTIFILFQLIKRHNFPHMPVRIFTYLIGKDSSSAENLHNMACQNKGFYAQIDSPEDAKRKVLEYALVMARPMVLYQADHPVHWSPVFVGGYSSLLGRDNEGKRKLVTPFRRPSSTDAIIRFVLQIFSVSSALTFQSRKSKKSFHVISSAPMATRLSLTTMEDYYIIPT